MKRRMKTNLVLIVIFLMVLANRNIFGLGPQKGSALGENVHNEIISKAIYVLNYDGYTSIWYEMDRYETEMQYGNWYADWGAGEILGKAINARDHYMYYLGHQGLLIGNVFMKPAGDIADDWFDLAVNWYNQGDYIAAYRALGITLHLIEDLAVPQHAMIQMGYGHEYYESHVPLSHIYSWDCANNGYFASSCGRYTFPSLSGHYNDDSPWGWVDRMAHYSGPEFEKVSSDTGCDGLTGLEKFACLDDYEQVYEDTLDAAIWLTAGFMKFFFDRVERPYKVRGSYLQLADDGDSDDWWCITPNTCGAGELYFYTPYNTKMNPSKRVDITDKSSYWSGYQSTSNWGHVENGFKEGTTYKYYLRDADGTYSYTTLLTLEFQVLHHATYLHYDHSIRIDALADDPFNQWISVYDEGGSFRYRITQRLSGHNTYNGIRLYFYPLTV